MRHPFIAAPAVRRVALACAASLLLACSTTEVGPHSTASSARLEADADAYYVLGRNYYSAQRYDAAYEAYQHALAQSPRHVDARNGLAVLYAARGELPAAIAIWRDLTAASEVVLGSGPARLFNNLGYAYLQVGDAAKALAALERACLLDPLNDKAWENLGLALNRLGEHERAAQAAAQSETLRQHDLKADLAIVAQASAAPLLEISNGNGVRGMAAALGRRIDGSAYRLARLSNQRGFGVQRTRIEYQDGNEDAAFRLAAWLQSAPPGKVAPLVQRSPVNGAAIRLVIGHDLVI